MRTQEWIARLLALILLTGGMPVVGGGQACKTEHEVWLAKALEEIQTIQPGMTRQDLLRVFRRPGGIYSTNRLATKYAYKGTLYINVDVEFTPAAGTEDSSAEDPRDVIKTISRPYLAPVGYD